jgi:hypothetical protein
MFLETSNNVHNKYIIEKKVEGSASEREAALRELLACLQLFPVVREPFMTLTVTNAALTLLIFTVITTCISSSGNQIFFFSVDHYIYPFP